ncbi:hypothetical protein [Pseudomonas sp. NBRC 111143]|uniref:hypothetical protein n=1 Tax=Pseudomonas sp. NBRC 111143 TaxID=1661058 RepID=UPI0012E16F00|nr:hypothetical protein [Pseudomonas sp. NBRC 111143]
MFTAIAVLLAKKTGPTPSANLEERRKFQLIHERQKKARHGGGQDVLKGAAQDYGLRS